MTRQEAEEIINRSNPEIDAKIAFADMSDEDVIFEAQVIEFRKLDDPPSQLEVLHSRMDLIRIADHLIAAIDAVAGDVAVRALLNASIDDYYYDKEEINARLELKGRALREEMAMHVVQAFVNINTTKGREIKR